MFLLKTKKQKVLTTAVGPTTVGSTRTI